jgi:hypothetical protein
MSPQVQHDLAKAMELLEHEVRLRQAGRAAEVKLARGEAERLFRRASGLRRLRIALLERCGLL